LPFYLLYFSVNDFPKQHVLLTVSLLFNNVQQLMVLLTDSVLTEKWKSCHRIITMGV